MILPKFTTIGLFILILDISAIMDQNACWYVLKTSKIGLLRYLEILDVISLLCTMNSHFCL